MNQSRYGSSVKKEPAGAAKTLLVNVFCAVFLLLASALLFVSQANEVMQTETTIPAPKSLGNYHKPLIQYTVSHWNRRDGLPHNSVNNITQTTDGYLWLATWEGPVRFNGRNFDVFDNIDDLGLPESGVMGITHNPQNNDVYIAGPRGGIARYNGENWNPLPEAPAFVFRVQVDQYGEVWAAAAGGGVVRYDGDGNMHRYRLVDGLTSDFAYRIYHTPAQGVRDAEIYVGTSRGLARYDRANNKFVSEMSVSGSQIRALVQHSNGMLLVASDDGLFYQNEPQQPFYPWPNPIQGTISAIAEGPEGSLWYGTITHGLGKISDRGMSTLNVEQGLPNPHVLDIFRDHEENMWVSTHGGLVQLRDALFTSFTRTQGLIGDYVRAVTVSNNRKVWIGTSEGLSVFQSGAEPLFSDILTEISILSLYHDAAEPEDTIYVGAYTEGLLQLTNGETTARFGRDEGLSLAEVRAIARVPESDLLIAGTPIGLLVLRVAHGSIELVRKFGLEDGLIDPTVTGVAIADNGDIWTASTAGITRIHTRGDVAAVDKWRATAVHIDSVTPARNTFAIASYGGYTWFASDRGILVFSEQEYQLSQNGNPADSRYWRVINRQSGLPFEKYFALAFDFEGNLWLGGSRGVTRVDAGSLQAWLTHNTPLSSASHYVETDGMNSSQVNTGGPSVVRDIDGHIWFATSEGVAVIPPENVEQHNLQAPPTVIESARADLASITNKTKLPASSERIEFQYIGLGFRMARHIQYQVRLIGFDDDWIDRNDLTVADYTSLPPGDFTFAVRSRYPGGNWSEPATISFTKAPHIYQTWWFWVLLILVLMGVVWTRIRALELSRLRLKQLVAEKTVELEALANEDSLTGASNRRAFDDRLFTEIKRAKRSKEIFSVAVVDLDHFKQINDRHMHEIGDRVLQIVATVMNRTVREVDFVARWGGEEFVILFPNTDCARAAEVCERVRFAIEGINFSDIADALKVTASIGVAEINAEFDHQDVLKRADQALYAAKRAGRNIVIRDGQVDA